jgi:hypothetical protein
VITIKTERIKFTIRTIAIVQFCIALLSTVFSGLFTFIIFGLALTHGTWREPVPALMLIGITSLWLIGLHLVRGYWHIATHLFNRRESLSVWVQSLTFNGLGLLLLIILNKGIVVEPFTSPNLLVWPMICITGTILGVVGIILSYLEAVR